MRVRAPWIKHYYNADGKFYIIPNLDTVVLGGTLNHNSWDTCISQQVLCWHMLPVPQAVQLLPMHPRQPLLLQLPGAALGVSQLVLKV